MTSGESTAAAVELRAVDYTHPDVVALVAEVQQEYVRRYGGPDEAPMAQESFAAPLGAFFVLYADAEPVAMGGWRTLPEAPVDGRAAEVKRMYVAADHRRRGLARRLLRELERTAAEAGADWLILETGEAQPEAIQLYQSAGYQEVPAFGHYAGWPGARHFGKRLVGSAP